jgi:hypothetical protein
MATWWLNLPLVRLATTYGKDLRSTLPTSAPPTISPVSPHGSTRSTVVLLVHVDGRSAVPRPGPRGQWVRTFGRDRVRGACQNTASRSLELVYTSWERLACAPGRRTRRSPRRTAGARFGRQLVEGPDHSRGEQQVA